MPEFPFAQATLRGFHTILPPQEKPAHLFAIGAVILMMASYGKETIAFAAALEVYKYHLVLSELRRWFYSNLKSLNVLRENMPAMKCHGCAYMSSDLSLLIT